MNDIATPGLSFVCDLLVLVTEPIVVGATTQGTRRGTHSSGEYPAYGFAGGIWLRPHQLQCGVGRMGEGRIRDNGAGAHRGVHAPLQPGVGPRFFWPVAAVAGSPPPAR